MRLQESGLKGLGETACSQRTQPMPQGQAWASLLGDDCHMAQLTSRHVGDATGDQRRPGDPLVALDVGENPAEMSGGLPSLQGHLGDLGSVSNKNCCYFSSLTLRGLGGAN